MAETLQGVVERVTFHNADNGWAVLKVQVRGRRGLATVVGGIARVAVGENVEAVGDWVEDRDYGPQFKATALRCLPPGTAEGIEKYLASGLVKGIGPHMARKIVEAFGERTLEVIDQSPTFLREVKGIGPKRIQRIRVSWQEQKAVRGIMVFLQSHGVGVAKAARIYRTYGDQAVEAVRANPYRLASEVWGFGFQTADELAAALGVDRASPYRARAALLHTLQQLSQKGHVGYPETAVLEQTAQALPEMPREVLEAAAAAECHNGDLVREPGGDEPWLYLKGLFLAERTLALNLRKLAEGDHPLPPGDPAPVLARVEQQMGLELAPSQRRAVAEAMRRKVLVVTGGPGVGKSTIVRGVLEAFAGRGLRCGLCAPTGRAAKRLSETTGREAKTIHRLLEFDSALGGFKRDAANPLDLDLLVVDEASMVDVSLMHQLARAAPRRACLVLVGDVDQLPSVGPGVVLRDVIESETVPVVRLTEVFRQAGRSWIVRAAHAVLGGAVPESAPPGQGDFYFVEASTPEAILDRLLTMVRERIPRRFGLDALRDVQVLTPMNRSALGAEALNRRLQEALNPPGPGKAEVERFGCRFRAGDKVLQTRNNYQKEVFNGDVGRVQAIDAAEGELTVDFDSRPVVYDFSELDELKLAYSLTIHKGQGSEYPAVVIPLHMQHFMMLQRNLLYTGLTRGKKLVALVGERQALDAAVRRQDTARRCSALARRLRENT
jgi:exodeoxyribonuclease V alpha subunit